MELLGRIVDSANQLSVHGAVTNWCETLGRTESEKRENSGQELNQRLLRNRNFFNTEEIDALVNIPRTPPASGDRTHQKLQSFVSFSAKRLLKHLYERAGFQIQWREGQLLSDSS